MVTKYYAVLTNVGAAKLANATALGAQVEITQMAVGDGNGVLPTPNPAQTALVHELRRKPLNSLSIDPNNANQIIAEQVIPEDEGGWWIREIGLFDKDGDMIAVANCAETYKPQLQEGSGRVQVVRMILIVSSTAAVTLKIDPSVVLATRQYVDDQIIQVKSYVDQKMAAHVAAADPHKQYAPKESPALTGTPTAPTAAQTVNSTQIATTAFVKAAITALNTTINTALGLKAPLASPALTGTPTAPTAAQTVNSTQIATTAYVKAALSALVDSSPAALDTLNELAAALGNDPNFATTMTNLLALKAPLASPDLTGTPTAPTAAQTVNSTQIATTAFVKAAITALNTTINTDLGLKAPLASPALTGTPTAPTAAAATNNTQVATTAFVQNGLKTKQDADSTLSDLSGKTVAGLLTYLGLRTAAKADVVGTVSQSGGVPTGAIIERGSNSNGEYTKFADGTLICWFTRSVESITSNPSGGTTNLYFSTESVFTFPATFVGTKPAVAPSAPLSSGGTSSWPSVRGSSLTGTSLALISNVQNAAAYLGYTAVGRWF
ncbi:hypothetical protein OIPHN330_50980 [Citrobacter freundii]|uniref:phage tail protein n=1 Tax=Citrobacter freundii TaxID=546 RepID=UPI002B2EC8B0|nr:hypothetical protein OIPHN330_50980 [Citrobacter freundii]BEJ42435.1 hypothetical protein OIPHN354_51470 [Citrobacter freundii]